MELSLTIIGTFIIVVIVVLLIKLLFGGPQNPNLWDI